MEKNITLEIFRSWWSHERKWLCGLVDLWTHGLAEVVDWWTGGLVATDIMNLGRCYQKKNFGQSIRGHRVFFQTALPNRWAKNNVTLMLHYLKQNMNMIHILCPPVCEMSLLKQPEVRMTRVMQRMAENAFWLSAYICDLNQLPLSFQFHIIRRLDKEEWER